MESLCAEPVSLRRSPDEARRWLRRDDSPFMSQFPPEEMMGTSKDELTPLGLSDRDPCCRKEDFQTGKVCIFFPGLVAAGPVWLPRRGGEVLDSTAAAGPSNALASKGQSQLSCAHTLGACSSANPATRASSGKVQGSLSKVLQLVRSKASSPHLRNSGPALLPAIGEEG